MSSLLKYKPGQVGTPPKKLSDEQSRMLLYRLLVILCLAATAALGGYGSYYQVYHYETKLEHSGFDSIAEHFQREVTINLKAKVLTLHAQASMLSMACPSTESWPNCTIPMESYANISNPLIENSNMRTLSFAPIITANQVDEFEAFAYNFYESEGYPDLGISTFGKGISALNQTSGARYHDQFGYQFGENKILVPLLEVGNLLTNKQVAMFNLYSEANRVKVIDHIIDCFESTPSETCTSVTDVVFLIQDTTFRPAVLVMHPISPRLDRSALTGFVQSVFSWDTVLLYAIPHYVNSLDVVLSGGEKSYTFRVHCGVVTLTGEGDTHQRKYTSQGKAFAVEAFSGRVAYTLSIYPTEQFVNNYHTNNPWYAMTIAVGVILLTSAFFYMYDKSMCCAAVESELRTKIETKRLFVRFISHEIRTPLNTVHIGLKLLVSEMMTFLQADPSVSPGTVAVVNDWVGVIRDIDESSDSAIVVLNDLLNYDKISTNTLSADFELVSLWDTVRDTTKPFYVQARSCGVSLLANIEVDNSEVPLDRRRTLQRLVVVGDRAKLGQVVRNLLSNALKFSRPGSVVEIRVHWEDDGLKDALLPQNSFVSGAYANEPKVGTKRWMGDSAVVPAPIQMPEAADAPQQGTSNRAGSLVVTVADSGVGLSQEDQASLFQEGARYQANQLQPGQGSGLGLWISKGIVDLHAGRLTAFSVGVGKGSEFRCELPCVLLAEEDDSVRCGERHNSISTKTERIAGSYHSSTPTSATRRLPSMSNLVRSNSSSYSSSPLLVAVNRTTDAIRNVMVVDDSTPSRAVVARLLRNAGYEVCEAVDGQDCLEQIQRRTAAGTPVDLVLMDFEMPRMNGPEATRRLRETGHFIPIIGVTGNVLPADKEFFITHGANAVLHKPLSIVQLQTEIARLNRVGLSTIESQQTDRAEGSGTKNYFSDEYAV